MVKEAYSYDLNPYIANFKAIIRTPKPELTHPEITRKIELADHIHANIFEILNELPSWLPKELIPHLADQGIILTPYDKFEGMTPVLVGREVTEAWHKLHYYNLNIINHPARIHAMQALENKGFTPPQKANGVIDRMLREMKIPQLADLGQASLSNDMYNENTLQTHRTELLATGPFTLIGGNAFNMIGMGAMPDSNGSVLAGTTAAQMFTTFGLPEVGYFSDPQKQAYLAKAIIDNLNIDNPILEGRSKEEKEYVVNKWRKCPVGVLEVNSEKALRRAEILAKNGITSFRIYGHTVGGDLVKTTRALRKEYPEAIIFAGQVSDINIALSCEEAEADALIIGVGAGGRCTTAELSALIPTMAALAWKLRGKVNIPLVGEGGVIDHPIVAALSGFSMFNGSGSITGGTIESPGGPIYLYKDGKYFKPYGGEASPRTKWLSGRTYATGLPYIPEGEEGFKQLIKYQESMTQKMLTLFDSIIMGAVVMGLDQGPFILEAFHKIGPQVLMEKTRTTSHSQGTH